MKETISMVIPFYSWVLKQTRECGTRCVRIRCYSRSSTPEDVEFVASKLGDRASKINRCETSLLLNSLASLLAQ